MRIDLQAVPPETRALLLQALGDSLEAIRALRAGFPGPVEVPLEKLGVVEAMSAMVRSVAANTDGPGRAALRDLLVELTGVRDDLRAPGRKDEDALLDGNDDDWTPAA